MANPRMLIRNVADQFTLSASPALLAGLPEGNLLLDARYRTARSTSLATQQIKGTSGTAYPVTMFALGLTNTTAAATVRFQGYSDVAWTTQVIDTGTVTAWPYTALDSNLLLADAEYLIFRNIVRYFASQNIKSWTITITDGVPANPDGYFDQSLLGLGSYWEWSSGLPFGGESGSVPTSTSQWRKDGGSLEADKGDNWLHLELNQDQFTVASDFAKLRAAAIRLGLDRTFWFSGYPGDGTTLEAENQGFCKFVDSAGWDRHVPLMLRSKLIIEGI